MNDIDIDSELFRSLPTETQYEIIGELRLKSRQTSWDKIQEMTYNTPISFLSSSYINFFIHLFIYLFFRYILIL